MSSYSKYLANSIQYDASHYEDPWSSRLQTPSSHVADIKVAGENWTGNGLHWETHAALRERPECGAEFLYVVYDEKWRVLISTQQRFNACDL
jgi:hypothetical protein